MEAVCSECTTLNPAENRFCNRCGASLEGARMVEEVVPPPAPPAGPPESFPPTPPPTPPEPEKKRGKGRWLVVAGVMVALCICGAFGFALLGALGTDGDATPTAGIAERTEAPAATEAELPTEPATPTDLPAPSDTPQPTQPPEPTDTPEAEPTATVEPPTQTPEPTDTVVPPTQTPEPGPPPEVQLYILEVVEQGTIIGEAMTAFSELMLDPRLGDQDWIVDLAVQMAVVQAAHRELEEMDVPPGMAEFHEGLLDGTQDCFDAMDYASSGIDNLDVGDLEKATELILSCGTKIADLPEMLEEFMTQFE